MKKLEGLTEDHKQILVVPLESGDAKGTTIAELRKIDKMCTAIESATDGVVEFEDADYEFLLKKFKSFSGWMPKARAMVFPVADILGVE